MRPHCAIALAALAFAFASCSANGTGAPPIPASPLSAARTSGAASRPMTVVGSNGSSITVTGPVSALGSNRFTIDEGSGGGYVHVDTSASTSYAGAKPFVGENVLVTGSGTFGSTIAASSVAQQILLPSGTLALTGPVSNAAAGIFTIDAPNYGYTHVYTNSQTTFAGGTPKNGEYAQAVGPGSSSVDATFVSLWGAAPGSVSATGTIAAWTPLGFTLNAGANAPAVRVVLASSTHASQWPMAVGETASVTGAGSLAQGVVATSVTVASPSAGPTPKPVVLVSGGVIGQDNRFSPPDGDTPSGGTGQSVDGIPCAPSMSENAYHVHAYVGLLVNGTQIAIPDQIGLVDPGPVQNGLTTTAHCYYYIHTHDATGMIHVESPSTAPLSSSIYTLGNLMDVWGETLSTSGFGPFSGTVRLFYDKVPLKAASASSYTEYAGNFNALPLYSHEAIWIEVGPTYVLPPNIPAVDFYTEY